MTDEWKTWPNQEAIYAVIRKHLGEPTDFEFAHTNMATLTLTRADNALPPKRYVLEDLKILEGKIRELNVIWDRLPLKVRSDIEHQHITNTKSAIEQGRGTEERFIYQLGNKGSSWIISVSNIVRHLQCMVLNEDPWKFDGLSNAVFENNKNAIESARELVEALPSTTPSNDSNGRFQRISFINECRFLWQKYKGTSPPWSTSTGDYFDFVADLIEAIGKSKNGAGIDKTWDPKSCMDAHHKYYNNSDS